MHLGLLQGIPKSQPVLLQLPRPGDFPDVEAQRLQQPAVHRTLGESSGVGEYFRSFASGLG